MDYLLDVVDISVISANILIFKHIILLYKIFNFHAQLFDNFLLLIIQLPMIILLNIKYFQYIFLFNMINFWIFQIVFQQLFLFLIILYFTLHDFKLFLIIININILIIHLILFPFLSSRKFIRLLFLIMNIILIIFLLLWYTGYCCIEIWFIWYIRLWAL